MWVNVEIIELEKLASCITPEICKQLGEIISNKKLYDNPRLIEWLNELVVYLSDDFGKIPFIVHNNSLFSLDQLVFEPDAWIINRNTSDYETLFVGLGYNTINLQLDKYINIKNHLNSFKNYYINDKTLAYERIASNPKLPKLAPSFKLDLVDFLQNNEFMRGIGGKKYFEELKLFVDEKGKPRPLRKMINRKDVLEIESLKQFRIIEHEYKILSPHLKKELINSEDVFTSFILESDLFEEWSLQFNSNNIEAYVNDLKTIFSWKDEDKEILSSQWAAIPWFYIDDKFKFIGSDKVFWSTAFSQMTHENYEKVKNIFHQSKLKMLPLIDCGALVQVFKLKTDNELIADWTIIKNLDINLANILLDWMENDGAYSDFFNEYTLRTNNENLFSIEKTENTQVFNGSDSNLKDYIQSNEDLNLLFSELDVDLCCDTRDKIGVLQGNKLLNAVIQSKSFDQNLAVHLARNWEWKDLESFICNLPVFSLVSEKEYNSKTPEHAILSNILRYVEDVKSIVPEVQTAINYFRDKIKIDHKPLNDYNLSNRIQFGKIEDKKVLKLSEVLEEFKGESDILENLIESLISIKEKKKLRELIFKTRTMRFEEIISKIEEESSPFLSEYQVVFLLLHQKYYGRKINIKQYFNDYWEKKGDKIQLEESYKSFLNILLDIDFTEISDFTFCNLELKNCVDKHYAIETEKLPQWLEKWVELDQIKRLDFISKLGFNNEKSPIVKLRQEITSEDYDENTVIHYFKETKANTQLVWNTIKWLSSRNSDVITRNITLIKYINEYITLKNGFNAITIPIIESINKSGVRSYILKEVNIKSKLYVINTENEFSNEIFSILKKENEEIIFVDYSCGNKLGKFSTELVRLKESVDSEILESDSKLWEETFYKKWECRDQYPIYIFKGKEIPYKRTFNEITINRFTQDLSVKYDNKYYIAEILNSDVLNNLPTVFPKETLSKLKEWEYKTLKHPSLLDDDSFEYKENIDRLLQDRLGISEESQKTESGNTKVHAVYFLDKEGFDVSEIDETGASLTNIINPDGKKVSCIVRSAKGGLLYLDKEHWDMLESAQTYLVVVYPGNTPRLFKDRLELLNEELAENVLFRIPNTKRISEINGVFNALKSEPHLILVTSEKMKEDLFGKLNKKNGYNQEKDVAIKGDNFNFI